MLQKEIKENKKQVSFQNHSCFTMVFRNVEVLLKKGLTLPPSCSNMHGFLCQVHFQDTHTHTKKCICTFIQPINATVFVLISFSHEAELFQSKLIPRNTNQRCVFVAQEPALSLAELGLGVPAESTASSLPTEPRVGCKPPLQIQQ